jgi:hypothetical protein
MIKYNKTVKMQKMSTEDIEVRVSKIIRNAIIKQSKL